MGIVVWSVLEGQSRTTDSKELLKANPGVKVTGQDQPSGVACRGYSCVGFPLN